MQTIGERLEEARKRKGASIREVAEATKIRGDYLQKFENNQFDIKLPEIYVRGFLRTYANYLKIPADKLMKDYDALGLGEGGRPQTRLLNREIYGKMEISHTGASAKNSAAATDPAGSTSTAANTAESAHGPAQRPAFKPRMPLGGLDRTLLAKNSLWIGLAATAGLALLAWGLVVLLSPRIPSHTEPANASATFAEPVYLVALRPVQIISIRSTPDGPELAPPRTLAANERYPLPNTDMLVTVSAREAVQFEYKGQRLAAAAGLTGPGTLGFKALP